MLKINCYKCEEELDAPGALIFSEPDIYGSVFKIHICRDCYRILLDQWLKGKDY